MRRRTGWARWMAGAALCAGTAGRAAELHSNGLGGGPWTEPGSWHGKVVPGTGDVAVVAAGDTIVFDGNCTNGPACRQIMIDPKAVLTFKADNARHVLSVGGPIEAYGVLRLDGTKGGEQGVIELNLAGDPQSERAIKLQRGAALFIYGADRRIDGHRNVLLTTPPGAPGVAPPAGDIFINPETMADISRATLSNIIVNAQYVDNTGYKPAERLNVVDNQFVGVARIAFYGCDTPMIQRNRFVHGGASPAVSLNSCKLAQVNNNIFTGPYVYAAYIVNDTDSSFAGNTVSAANPGLYWYGPNAMIKGNVFNDCPVVGYLYGTTGVMEDTAVRGSNAVMTLDRSTVQFTDYRLDGPRPTNIVMTLELSAATLLNCNILPEQIKFGQPPAGAGPLVQAMDYLVVQVKGNRPARAEVEVRTAAASGGPPPGKADLNVRNAPAKLGADGLTPLPHTLRPLIVRTWSIERGGARKEAPFYDLIVSASGAKESDPAQVLKSQVIEPKPAWDRPEPNKAAATVEVTLP